MIKARRDEKQQLTVVALDKVADRPNHRHAASLAFIRRMRPWELPLVAPTTLLAVHFATTVQWCQCLSGLIERESIVHREGSLLRMVAESAVGEFDEAVEFVEGGAGVDGSGGEVGGCD